MSQTEIEAKIEFQETIGEDNPVGYQPVRITRVKYKASLIVRRKENDRGFW